MLHLERSKVTLQVTEAGVNSHSNSFHRLLRLPVSLPLHCLYHAPFPRYYQLFVWKLTWLWLTLNPSLAGRIRQQVRPSSGTAVYPHMPILHVARGHVRVARAMGKAATGRATRAIRRILGFWGACGGAKFPIVGDSLPWKPMNRCTKYYAASFILGGEIRNRTNKITNRNRYIHALPIGMCG